ncbi:Dephospho-CoA kinase (EC 2.7.1.24) [uncultured Gammaproteobacteria bacterium]|nr:Dephospho-CoA kinase (EC 2.7.1.24) [uncultured Gammaproteobacteria bacterium]CAC9613679.1 Dephospho-CoA kinase (EC 2.7.1.24) [uncultured Gammaproteobacteria bacterium]
MDILKIALTGGIACGKSQMAQVFAELGADVVRLDDISKQVTTPGSDGLRELVDAFGEKILNQDDELNRQVLRAILLENESNKNCIEVILHPKILKTMQEWQKSSQKPLNIVEIPLLIERNLAYLFDRVIILTCNEEKQLKRLKNRENIDEKQAKKMISMQTSHENRLKISAELPCDIIENNGTLTDLKKQTKQLYQKLNQSVGI